MAGLIAHCVMERHAERRKHPFNNIYRGCRFTEEEETVIHFLCQRPSLARQRYTVFGASFLARLTELSSSDIKDLVSYIQHSGWFSRNGGIVLWCAALALTNQPLYSELAELGQYRPIHVHPWRHNGSLCAIKWALFVLHQSYHSVRNLNLYVS